jgi:hypothetical protein
MASIELFCTGGVFALLGMGMLLFVVSRLARPTTPRPATGGTTHYTPEPTPLFKHALETATYDREFIDHLRTPEGRLEAGKFSEVTILLNPPVIPAEVYRLDAWAQLPHPGEREERE